VKDAALLDGIYCGGDHKLCSCAGGSSRIINR
jgi:hypothetical protein